MDRRSWIPLKISELIAVLAAIQNEHGDLPVYTEYDGNNFELQKNDVQVFESVILDNVKDLPKRVMIV